MNWSLPNCFPNHQKGFLTDMGMVRKVLTNEPLKDVTMEMVRVEEFEKSLCKDCEGVNLVFL